MLFFLVDITKNTWTRWTKSYILYKCAVMRYEVTQEEMIIYPNLNVSHTQCLHGVVLCCEQQPKRYTWHIIVSSKYCFWLRLLANHIKDAQNFLAPFPPLLSKFAKKKIEIFWNHVPVSISIHFLKGMFLVCIHGNTKY